MPGTCTYASASTFTMAGDQTTVLSKGDRLKLTQTTAKYFYVIGVSHSAGTTTVTVTGGTDYTLANAAITTPFYSKEASPNGFPTWFAFTVGFTGFSANPAGFLARFNIVGTTVNVALRGPNAGTSNATTFTLTGAPVAAKAVTNFSWVGFMWGQNAGSTVMAFVVIDPSTTTFVCAVVAGASSWTNTGNKACHICSLSYEF